MKILVGVLVVLAVAMFGVASVQAQDLMPGDQAPAFELPGSDGANHSLADYQGKTVVLAWFPKAFTGG